jgi:uncharacterized CHY-type Zn-finger protein
MAEKMTDEQALQRLKELIAIQFDSCNKEDWPYICHMSLSAQGRAAVERMTLEQIDASGCSVGQAFDRIERAYNPNRMED